MQQDKEEQHQIDYFSKLTNLSDIAKLLRIKPKSLSYILYFAHENRNKLYTRISLRKKNGGERLIDIPSPSLKIIQSRLSKCLQGVYVVKESAHGFIPERSIITNAIYHKRKKFVLNIDLKDFFTSINFGRVYGLFKSFPYSLPKEVAKVLAQIACNNEYLPQGSPCSPIISNMICSRLDSDLQRFAKKHHLSYTRYADDITFSSKKIAFPKSVCVINGVAQCLLGDELKNYISNNGFEINYDKVRCYDKFSRQEVTGLVINEFVNVPRSFIRNTRSMFYKWKTFGITQAAEEYNEKYKKINSKSPSANFHKALLGKINFIHHVRVRKLNRGPSQSDKRKISEHLYHQFFWQYVRDLPEIAIVTEGKTDWMHLKSAFKCFSSGYSYSLNFIELSHKEFPGGDDGIITSIKKMKEMKISPDFSNLTIIIFDRDNSKIISQHEKADSMVVRWSTNLFSIVLPKECCSEYVKFSIEFLYQEIIRNKINKYDRRLFLTNEFDKYGVYKKGEKYRYSPRGNDNEVKVVTGKVVIDGDEKKINHTMSKIDFAKSILNSKSPFPVGTFKNFLPIFEKIKEIYEQKDSLNNSNKKA